MSFIWNAPIPFFQGLSLTLQYDSATKYNWWSLFQTQQAPGSSLFLKFGFGPPTASRRKLLLTVPLSVLGLNYENFETLQLKMEFIFLAYFRLSKMESPTLRSVCTQKKLQCMCKTNYGMLTPPPPSLTVSRRGRKTVNTEVNGMYLYMQFVATYSVSLFSTNRSHSCNSSFLRLGGHY